MDAKVKNFRDWGIQLGRRFRALKLWFVIRSYGVEGLQKIAREHLRLAQLFKESILGDKYFELMAPVDLSVICFRLNDGRSEEELESLNKEFLEQLNETGEVFLSHTTLKGGYVLRMAIGARMTTERHVAKAWKLISMKAKDVLEK